MSEHKPSHLSLRKIGGEYEDERVAEEVKSVYNNDEK
jgi:hypothetical protein